MNVVDTLDGGSGTVGVGDARTSECYGIILLILIVDTSASIVAPVILIIILND